MRRIKTLALLVALVASSAVAQTNPYRAIFLPTNAVKSATFQLTAVDTSPALLIKYVGTTTQASTVAVTTDDVILTVGGAADTTVTGCGGTAGTLDTAQAACDTVTELVNTINLSSNWLAIPVAVLGTDATSSTLLKDVSSTSGNAAAGVPIYIDSAGSLFSGGTIYPSNTLDIRDYMLGSKPDPNKWGSLIITVEWYIQNFVGSAGAGAIYAVKGQFGGSTGKVYSETVRTLYSFTGAATGVDKELDFKAAPLFTNPGEKIVTRGASGSTHTSPVVRLRGFIANR